MSVYLDNSSTTAQRREVTEIMIEVMEHTWGNPSSLHRMGIEAEKLVKASRKMIASILSASEDEIYFTSGGTESDNTAIFGACEALRRCGNHIITTSIEHPAVLECFRKLEDSGFEVTYIDPDETGIVSAEAVKAALRDDTILVSVMHVNNETGALQPVEKIGAVLADRDHIFFHCDAVQSFGKIEIPIHKAKMDAVSASGHKIHGPKGIGILYVNHNSRIVPFMRGGGQERQMRSGTENVPGIVGMAKAAELAASRVQENLTHAARLRDCLLQGILAEIPDVKINSPMRLLSDSAAENGSNDRQKWSENGRYDDKGGQMTCLPYILNVSFLGTRAEVLLHMLEQSEIYVSTGSACSSNSKKKGSHVLRAMGLSDDEIEGAVRFSFSCQNTMEEIEETLEKLKDAVSKNRRMLALANKSKAQRWR